MNLNKGWLGSIFPNSRLENDGDRIYIYNLSRTKRWRIDNYIDERRNEQTNSLTLQARVGGVTWHTMMKLLQMSELKSGRPLKINITVDVITGDGILLILQVKACSIQQIHKSCIWVW